MKNLDFVTSEWIKEKMKTLGLKNSNLADILKVSASQISSWLAGTRNPSASAKAAIYYYFENQEMSNMRQRKDVLKLSTFQYLALHIPETEKRYLVTWNHLEKQFCINTSGIKEMSYIDVRRYNYILLDPEHEYYSVIFQIKIHEGELRLFRIQESDLSQDFDVTYNY
jgi:transcriptional regulator with XRE-family HTH domain